MEPIPLFYNASAKSPLGLNKSRTPMLQRYLDGGKKEMGRLECTIRLYILWHEVHRPTKSPVPTPALVCLGVDKDG